MAERLEIKEIEGKIYLGSFHSKDPVGRSLAIKAAAEAIRGHQVEEGTLIDVPLLLPDGTFNVQIWGTKNKDYHLY